MIKPELSISILDCPLTNLIDFITTPASEISLHIDIIDTSFCANLSFGLNQIVEITRLSNLKAVDLHFMIKLDYNFYKILSYLLEILHTRVRNFYLHVTSKEEFFSFMKKYSIEIEKYKGFGVSFDCDVSECEIKEVCNEIQRYKINFAILQMTIKAGKGGQPFFFKTSPIELVKRIRFLKQFCERVGLDGGICLENLDQRYEADFVVVGSAFHKLANKLKEKRGNGNELTELNKHRLDFINSYNKYFSSTENNGRE
ncbi:Ribulose-phosphate 3-epimerase [Cucumispora dikerogammari]|nr:Ribulose-phosphate 3-epimerase [Cucumispora dikerogammari]